MRNIMCASCSRRILAFLAATAVLWPWICLPAPADAAPVRASPEAAANVLPISLEHSVIRR
jgi:hypothetical protein